MKLVNLISNILKEDQETYGSPVLRKLDWDYETLVEWAAEASQEQLKEADYTKPDSWDPSPDNTCHVEADYEDEGIYLELQAYVEFSRYHEADVNYTEEKVTEVRSAVVTAYPAGNYDKSLASWDIAEDLQKYFSKNQ